MKKEKPPAGNDHSRLTGFEKQDVSFSERFVEAVLKEPSNYKTVGEEFGKAFALGEYLPSIIDAQHWAVEVLNASEVEPMKELADLELIGEIFWQCSVPYDTGEISYEAAKAKGVEMTNEFFAGSEIEIMYDGLPSSPEFFALHIYKMGELIDRTIKEETGFRKEVDDLAVNVDDYYFENTEAARNEERRRPYLHIVDAAIKIGFLYRDVWWLDRHGDAAVRGYSAKQTGAKAGEAGAAASRKRRRENLELLIDEIEKLSGAVAMISEDRIFEQAFETARYREPNFPKSRKTLDDYGTALRSEEPFKSRYEAVFGKNA